MPNNLSANALRALSIDMVEQAQSGHPGAPLGMADMAQVLWQNYLRHSPQDPQWFNRDRFILSNGHASALLYSLLHLSGYDLSIDDLKNFRQLHSKTPGHPELHDTPGVEATTGPLGQGLANAVGMAIAEKHLASTFNRPNHEIVDHRTFVFVGDGCLMEGISHEACSLAGVLGLGKLIVLYDDNNISIDGEVGGWYGDDTPARFRSYNWHVIDQIDGHDEFAIDQAISQAIQQTDKPSFICCKTTIGFGSPNKAATSSVHGSPLGKEEAAATKAALGWQSDVFEIPDDIKLAWDMREKGNRVQQAWQEDFATYAQQYPELASQLKRRISGDLPDNIDGVFTGLLEQMKNSENAEATRKSSQRCLEYLCEHIPEMIGGSADLTGSNLTKTSYAQPITKSDASGSYIYYGVREFAMAAVMNGIALHKGLIPFGGTFLIFMEYARNALRMAALMKQRSIFVLTHDSIGLGEDGPTHQPIEQLSSLRATPNLYTWRPCDAVETAIAWREAIYKQDAPSALILSRQSMPSQPHDSIKEIAKGGYILASCINPEIIFIATGSEVNIAMMARYELIKKGLAVRVVSMPCADVFSEQDIAYQKQVLPSSITKRIAIEAAHPDFWYKFVGLQGKVIGINSFGLSAKAQDLMQYFGLTTNSAVEEVLDYIEHS